MLAIRQVGLVFLVGNQAEVSPVFLMAYFLFVGTAFYAILLYL